MQCSCTRKEENLKAQTNTRKLSCVDKMVLSVNETFKTTYNTNTRQKLKKNKIR